MSRRHNRPEKNTGHLNRRQWLSTLGVGTVAGLAGCSDGDDREDATAERDTNANGENTHDALDLPDFPRFGVDDLYGEEVARALAREAFDESEYAYRFDGGDLVIPDGDRVEIDVYYNAGHQTSQLTAAFISRALGNNLGIDVSPEAIDAVRFDTEYWTAEPDGGVDTVDGEEIEWSDPSSTNPGSQSVTSNESWDMSLVFGLNTYPLNPLANEVFFDGAANASYNPVGYYPEFDARGLFEAARRATTREELREAVVEIFESIGREQPYITLLSSDDLIGYNADLNGPIENFSNGWDLPAWHVGTTDVSGSYDTVQSAGFTTLNPLYNTDSGAGTAIGRALDQGYTFDEDQEYFPLLYEMSTEHGEVWTFELRDGLEFSDPYGEVTAEDFVYLVQNLHQSEWANTAATTSWTGVEVEQTGEYEFQATLEDANLLWPETYDPLLYPIPRGLVEPYVEAADRDGLQENEALLELQFTGNLGAFTLDEWRRGSGTQYTRNDEYYLRDVDAGPDEFENAPLFAEASISIVEEQASRLEALATGEVDSAAIPPEQFDSYRENEAITVRRIPTPYNTILSVNHRDNGWETGPGNLFRITAFRQAVAAAIDKRQLIDDVYRGLAETQFTWQPRWADFYPDSESVTHD